MNNSQYVSYPHSSGQSLDYGPYNFAQMCAAQDSLFQQVGFGRLQLLSSRMRLNSFSDIGRVMTSNLWEGDQGMMEHVQPFPMPPCLSFSQEKSSSQSWQEDPPTWVNSGNDQDQFYEKYTEDYSEMSNSWDLEGSFRGPESSDNMRVESMFNNSTEENFRNRKRMAKKGNLKFLRKITNIDQTLNNAHKNLSTEKARLSERNPKVRKQVCLRLACLHKTSVVIQAKLKAAKQELETAWFINPLKISPSGAKHQSKEQHCMQGKLSSSLDKAVTNCNKLRSRMKVILHDQPKLMERHRVIMNDAIKDLLAGSNEDEPLLHGIIVDEGEGSTPQLERGSWTKEHLLRNEAEMDYVGSNRIEATDSSKMADDKIDYSNFSEEDIFWNNLTEFKKKICSTITAANIINTIPNTPNPQMKKQLMNNKCEQLVNMFKRIVSFKDVLSKLRGEMDCNNYAERESFGLDDFKRLRIRNLRSKCSCIDVVETLLNYLIGAYMRARKKIAPYLQKYGFITDTDDLTFNVGVESTSLIRICEHLETFIDIAAIYESSNEHNPNLDPQKAISSCNQGTHYETDADYTPAGNSTAGNSSPSIQNWAVGSQDCSNADDELSLYPTGRSREINPQKEHISDKAFLNNEIEHWNRMQRLYRKVEAFMKTNRYKSRTVWNEEEQIEMILKSVHNDVKKLTEQFATLESESNSAGYCTEVNYKNIEFHSYNSVRYLVKSLAHVKSRVIVMNEEFTDIAKKLGMGHLCNL